MSRKRETLKDSVVAFLVSTDRKQPEAVELLETVQAIVRGRWPTPRWPRKAKALTQLPKPIVKKIAIAGADAGSSGTSSRGADGGGHGQ